MKRYITLVLLSALAFLLKADPPKAPAGKVWVLNPLMSDEFGPNGPNPDVFNIYPKDRSWGRTAAFDPKAISMEKDSTNNGNYILNMNPLWYYEDEVWTSEKLNRTFTFAGAAMDTKNIQTYGYFEVRIRPSDFPMGSGVFMNSRGTPKTECLEKYSTELDIIENMGYTGPGAGEYGNKGGFFNYVQHTNSHTKDLKYVDGDGNCVQYDGWDAWDSRGADHYDLDDPHAFFTVGMWWKDAKTAHFYNNDRMFSTAEPARDFDIPMALILSMETYILWPNENNAGNPQPQEWMWEDTFRTRDQRAVKYDWVRTWKLVDIDSTKLNNRVDNVVADTTVQDIYKGNNLNATFFYSATGNRTVTASLIDTNKEVIADTTYQVTDGVRSLMLDFSSESITSDNENFFLKYTIADENSELASDSVAIKITEEPLSKKLFSDGIPTSLEPASSIDLDVKYEADTVCKLVVEVHKPNGDGLLWKAKVVQPGSGVVNFKENLSAPLEYGSGYYFRIYMFRNGMNWKDPQAVNLGNLYFDVEDPWRSSIKITEIDSIFSNDESIAVEFSYATEENGKLDLVLLDEEDAVVASNYREERYGNRTITRSLAVNSTLLPGDDYTAIVTYTPFDNAFETLSDTINNVSVYDHTLSTDQLNSILNGEGFKLYPNPTSGNVRLKLNNATDKISQIKVFDIKGSVIKMISTDIRSQDYTLDMSKFENGTFFIQVSTNSEVFTRKVIKN